MDTVSETGVRGDIEKNGRDEEVAGGPVGCFGLLKGLSWSLTKCWMLGTEAVRAAIGRDELPTTTS